jgi:hypothetical protein
MKIVAPFHEHRVEDVLHPPGVLGAAKQSVDQLLPFIRRGIVEKCAGLGRSRDHPGQVERDSPHELGVGRWGRWLSPALRFDSAIDRAVKRLNPGETVSGGQKQD